MSTALDYTVRWHALVTLGGELCRTPFVGGTSQTTRLHERMAFTVKSPTFSLHFSLLEKDADNK